MNAVVPGAPCLRELGDGLVADVLGEGGPLRAPARREKAAPAAYRREVIAAGGGRLKKAPKGVVWDYFPNYGIGRPG
jgi:hypothetical protein